MALDPAEIHYGIRGQKYGPIDVHTFVDRLHAGQVSADDYVWDEDLDDWVAIRRYEGLLDDPPDVRHEVDPDDPRLVASEAQDDLEEVPPAGFALRAVAFIVDSFVLLVPMMIWTSVYQSLVGGELPTLNEMLAAIVEARDAEYDAMMNTTLKHALGTFVIQGIYHVLMESSSWQATLGKRMLGIRVTDEKGQRITFARAVGRHCGRLLCQVTLLIGYLMVMLTKRGQGLHDKVAGTLVVRPRR